MFLVSLSLTFMEAPLKYIYNRTIRVSLQILFLEQGKNISPHIALQRVAKNSRANFKG